MSDFPLPAALLFSGGHADAVWQARFAQALADDPAWLERCERAVIARYVVDSAACDGFSRVGLGLARLERQAEAAVWFARDGEAGRMRRWQFLRYVETLLKLDRLEDATGVVADYYSRHPEAVDGWATVGWAHHRQGRYAAALELYERDRVAGRLTPFWVLRAAECLARAGDWAGAGDRIHRAYAADATLCDGFRRLAVIASEAGDWSRACNLYGEDAGSGRLTSAGRLDAAQCLARIEDWKGAQEQVGLAYAADGDLKGGFSRLAALAMKAGDWPRAKELFLEDAGAARLTPAGRLQLGEIHARLGELSAAANAVQEAYGADPALRDGYVRTALVAPREPFVNALPAYARDASVGRLTDEAATRALRLWLAEGPAGRLRELLAGLQPWMPFADQAAVARALLAGDGSKRVAEFLGAHLCRDGLLQLKGAALEIGDPESLEVMLTEILVAEDYRFETENPRPLIIDAGANFGLATYYFLAKHPQAEVIAFEPDPRMAAILRRNVASNGWSNVTVVEAALTAQAGRQVFHSTPAESMAGSLTERMVQRGVEHTEHEVECVPLSRFLDRPVEFLKLDIEGAEREVLEECAAQLGNVKSLFCEIHRLPGKGYEDLSAILHVLESAGFEVELTGPTRLGRGTARGMDNVDVRRSLELWARRRRE